MKKIMIIVVCLGLAIVFTGCGKKSETEQTKGKDESVIEKAEDEAGKAADKVDDEAKKATKALEKVAQ